MTKHKTAIGKRIHETTPLPGVRLFLVPTNVKGAVFIAGSLPGGSIHTPKNALVSSVAADMLDEGTRRQNRRTFREAFESIGASIEFSADTFRTRFSAQCLKQHVPIIFSLIAEALGEPRFGTAELSNAKARTIAEIEQQKENTQACAHIRLRQILFPRQHPNYALGNDESIRLVQKVTRRDLSDFARHVYGAGDLTIVVGGDVDSLSIGDEVTRVFGGWQEIHPQIPSFATARTPHLREETIVIHDKANIDVYIGGPIGISERHPAYLALSFGMFVLGGTFFGRLYQEVREKKGLTYGVRGMLNGGGDGLDGYWSVWGTFAPDLLEKGKTALRTEIARWVDRGITDTELGMFKETLRGSYTVALGTAARFTALALGNAEQNRPTTYFDEYLARIEALTKTEVNNAIRAHIDPDHAVTVSAGSIV